MSKKKSAKETAETFLAMTKALVSGNPKPKAKRKSKKKAVKK